MANSDSNYINMAAKKYHECIRSGTKYIRTHSKENNIRISDLEIIKEMLHNNHEINIATLYHIEKTLNVLTVRTENNLLFEKIHPSHARDTFQTGHITTTMAAHANKEMLVHWEAQLNDQYKAKNPHNSFLLGCDLRFMTDLGRLSAYLDLRKDFLPETFKQNTSLAVPTLEESFLIRMNAVQYTI